MPWRSFMNSAAQLLILFMQVSLQVHWQTVSLLFMPKVKQMVARLELCWLLYSNILTVIYHKYIPEKFNINAKSYLILGRFDIEKWLRDRNCNQAGNSCKYRELDQRLWNVVSENFICKIICFKLLCFKH